MFKLENNDAVVGKYLQYLILEKKQYKSVRQFCRAYLELRDGSTDDEEIRKLNNRILQILKGEKRLQTSDLPYITDLLDVSCEQVLSAGQSCVPTSTHMTNYDIVFSKDREVWDKYMKREDKLFLNCDEYCKSVLDYAFEFKNYDFIKYLLEEKYIWFVDNSDCKAWGGYNYGAGTSVKRRDRGSIDYGIQSEIELQDRLRTQTIALAIENNDCEILDSLLAREIPEMHSVTIVWNDTLNFEPKYNRDLILAIANTSSELMLDYFSEEFVVTSMQDHDNVFTFPFISDVIDAMLDAGKTSNAELFLRRSIKHNREALNNLKKAIEESYEDHKESLTYTYDGVEEFLRKQVMYGFGYNSKSKIVSFFYTPEKHKYIGYATNIIHVSSKKGTSILKELVSELNDLYDQIVSLGGEN